MTSYQHLRACFLSAVAFAGAGFLPEAVAQDVKPQASAPGQVPPLPPVLPEMIPAFPGAWGGGMFTTGGRGGRVIAVTNLNDSGEGSFRAAIEAEGPRMVVFRVAGIIYLKSAIDINNPDITIAGQSAPGDGVCLAHDSVNINTNNVIIRHLRVRRGRPEGGQGSDNIGGNPESQIVVDHCSTSWGMDENLSLYRHMKYREGKTDLKFPVKNLTVQYCISSEALNAKNHAFGGTWGGQDATFHHNLLACNTGRNPSIGMGGEFDYRNNVVFNWRHRTMDGGDETSMINVINNYYKPGPATNENMRSVMVRIEQRDQYSPGRLFEAGNWYPLGIKRPGKWYVAGNLLEGYPGITADNWKGMQGPEELARVNTAFEGWPVNQQSAEDAYEAVLASAGATLPRRDAVDARVIRVVRTGKVHNADGIVKDPAEVGGYPEYAFDPASVPADSDGDGMPDVWEKDHGLGGDNPADGAIDSDNDGYTNIEEFLNGTDPQEAIDYRNLGNNVDTISFTKSESAAAPTADPDPGYTKVLIGRAEKILDGMAIEESERRLRVRDLIIAQYRSLSSIHDQRDAELEVAQSSEVKDRIRAGAQEKVDTLHRLYLASLGTELSTEQIDQVKDGMTYGVVEITYAAYLKMLPGLTAEQKAVIRKNLIEARELAMDGGSSKEKHGIFGKFKGRINNYLSKESYDLKAASKAVEDRNNAVAPSAAKVIEIHGQYSTVYSAESGYGWESDGRFSVAVPEGNHRITVTIGRKDADVLTTIKAELRRLMVEACRTRAGEFKDVTFVVNTRRPEYGDGKSVRLKDRERATEWIAWDEKVSLEFIETVPSVQKITIESVDDLPTVFLLGDSTVCDQPVEPYASWGQMLPRFFGADVAVANHGESGESYSASLGRGRLNKIADVMKPGDYLFLQFGHNDMKEKGEGKGAFLNYKEGMKRHIAAARKAGGIPVLITPMHRRNFDDRGAIVNTFGDYPEAVRQTAEEENVPLIDLQRMSAILYEALGAEGSGSLFKDGDGSHHNSFGAYQIAKCVVEGIRTSVPAVAKWLAPGIDRYSPEQPDLLASFEVPPSSDAVGKKPDGN